MSMSCLRRIGLALVVLALFVSAFQVGHRPCGWCAEIQGASKAGVARIDITPAKPVTMSGYASRKELSTGVHDPLFARAVVLESDGVRLVLVSADLIGFYQTYEPMRDAICDRFDLKPSQIFLSAIHTHAAPTPTLSASGHPHNLQYTSELRDKLLQVIGEAMESVGPVQMGAGRGYSAVGSNRREMQPDGTVRLGRNPYGPTDKEVLVIKLARPDGKPIATLFDYATHATSLGPANLQISGDVLGLAAQFVERVLGPDVIAPVFAGASGDIDPWYRVLPTFETANGWIPETQLLGMLLGQEVVHVDRDTKAAASAVPIASDLVTLQLPGRLKEGDDPAASRTKALNVTAARVGNVGLVGVGCELLTEVGMAIKAGSPYEYTLVITHCNGSAGYLPPKHLYKEGGYEIDSTGFGPQAADMLVKQALEMLYRLR